ncbi:hypothetical protein BH09VER1_BH09VER1_28060 [soil metagenome]
MFGLQTADLIVIGVYSLILFGIGLAAMLRIKNQEDFFLGGRRFGKFFQIFSAFGQATGTETGVATVTTTYRDGAGGIWSNLLLLWATPFYWFTAPWYRRMRVLTMGDFFRERYDSRALAMFYSVAASFLMITSIGIGFKAMSVTVLGITMKPEAELNVAERGERGQALHLKELESASAAGTLSEGERAELTRLRDLKPRSEFSYISENWLIWSIVVMIFLYGILGGLEAAVWIDSVQGTLILVLSGLLIPFAVFKLNIIHGSHGFLGAMEVLHRELPGHFFSVFGSPSNADFTWYFIAASSLMATINVAVLANQLTANACAKDELTARVGFTTGNYLKRFCTVMWGLTGLLAYGLYSRQIQNPDLIWGHATRDLLGGLGIGLVGLMIACLLSALQAMTSTHMISAASLFTKNVYEPLRPGRGEGHYVLVGRMMGTLILIGAALLCTAFGTILEMLKFNWEFNAVFAAAFWCGIKWRRTTRGAAWSSVGVAFVLFLGLPLALPALVPGLRTGEQFLRKTKERVIVDSYEATPHDVEQRRWQIEHWTGSEAAPAALVVGERVARTVVIPPKPIYWSQGIRSENGVPTGRGMFYPEMYVLDRVVDLSANPYALNETIRYLYKILLPFLIVIVISLLSGPRVTEPVSQFFLRMRTEVKPEREEDDAAVAVAYARPEETVRKLLFPRSGLEFFKWNRVDTLGFLGACGLAFAVMGLLYLVVSLGS